MSKSARIESRRCSQCLEKYPNSDFSKTQRSNGTLAKCIGCVKYNSTLSVHEREHQQRLRTVPGNKNSSGNQSDGEDIIPVEPVNSDTPMSVAFAAIRGSWNVINKSDVSTIFLLTHQGRLAEAAGVGVNCHGVNSCAVLALFIISSFLVGLFDSTPTIINDIIDTIAPPTIAVRNSII